MCVLVVLLRQIPGYPIVVGANRDESLVRPSAGPTLDRDGGVLAPTDLLAGGTWIGVNRDGLFAAITNRSGARPDPGRASRGTLVRAALATPDVAAAAARVDRLQAAAPRNGFNLVLAGGTGDGLLVTGGGLPPPGGAGDGRRVLEPGLHVLT
ncbi:MAG: NRDE family protein, partial [Candidatus Eiseniibacteriota bacterium]